MKDEEPVLSLLKGRKTYTKDVYEGKLRKS